MAGIDYLKCEICGERIMYEPDRDQAIEVVCMSCYQKHNTTKTFDIVSLINKLYDYFGTNARLQCSQDDKGAILIVIRVTTNKDDLSYGTIISEEERNSIILTDFLERKFDNFIKEIQVKIKS